MDVVTKGEFAKLRGCSAARVSQLISQGKIKPHSLHGEGRSARIIVERALADLGDSLQPGGLMGRALRADVAAEDAPAAVAAPARATPPVDGTATRYQRAKMEEQEVRAREARRRELAAQGLYMPAEEARQEMAATLRRTLTTMDAWLQDVAMKLAAELGIDEGKAKAILRREFRALRQRESAAATAARDAADQYLADDLQEGAPVVASKGAMTEEFSA